MRARPFADSPDRKRKLVGFLFFIQWKTELMKVPSDHQNTAGMPMFVRLLDVVGGLFVGTVGHIEVQTC